MTTINPASAGFFIGGSMIVVDSSCSTGFRSSCSPRVAPGFSGLSRIGAKSLIYMEPMIRFELTTHTLRISRSRLMWDFTKLNEAR